MNEKQKQDKKREKKLKREERIKKQKLLQKEALSKETKENTIRERLQYQTRQRKTPIVNNGDTALERNIKILEEQMAQHEALQQFREDNKEKSQDLFDDIQNKQSIYAEQCKEDS